MRGNGWNTGKMGRTINMQNYPTIHKDTQDEVLITLKRVVELRSQDITDRNNFPNIFMTGRKVAKVPATSNDIAATDNELDFNYDDTYFYYAILISGNLKWRRIAHGAF